MCKDELADGTEWDLPAQDALDDHPRAPTQGAGTRMRNREPTGPIDELGTGLMNLVLGPLPGCEECGLEHVSEIDDDVEAYKAAEAGRFVWSGCGRCRTWRGGDRYPAHGEIPGNGEQVHVDICAKCYMHLRSPDEYADPCIKKKRPRLMDYI